MNHWINKIFLTLILLLSGCDKTDNAHNTALVTGFYNTPLFIGKVRAIKQQPMQSPTDGMIIEVSHYPGQTVKKGDVIVKIESEEAGKRGCSTLSKQSLEKNIKCGAVGRYRELLTTAPLVRMNLLIYQSETLI